ncbi:MoaD/ThiS family protein [Alteromonas sp. CYL-A6]|uniref:MoaD/ThiS family protein n=1 Tax=Alteromonas nitratireducens TaxID=3390813 RepID=UPI0034C2D305
MQITVKSFAQIREVTGDGHITVAVNDNATIDELKAELCAQNDRWQAVFDAPVLIACNQTLVMPSHSLNPHDEVAFFPPVTGG